MPPPPPPTKHHLMTKHPYCAYQHRRMNAFIFKAFQNDPMIRHSVFKKLCLTFLHFTLKHLILVCGFGCGKVHFQNYCVLFWVWVNTFLFLNVTLLCVIVSGDTRGLAHWNVLIMFILGVVHLIFTKPNSKKEKDCLVKRWDQHFLIQNKTILGFKWLVLGWDLDSFTKQNKGNQRTIKLNV
jgi:hypothetical protein